MRSLADASATHSTFGHKRTSARLERYPQQRIAWPGKCWTSIYLSHPIKTFSTSKTAGQRIAILELSTNDLRRIRGAAALIEEAVGEIQPAELRRLEIP